MSYIKKNFMLSNKTAEKLFFNYAEKMPIFDYHCHLNEKQILDNKEFNDVYDLWLGGDHYKWRLMRNYGIDEKFITGNASKKDKFIAYCYTLSSAFGNPLYHWSQYELKFYFNCDLTINKENAEKIYEHCNKFIKENHLTPQKIIEQSNVKTLFTTNEIFDDLITFKNIKKKGYKFDVAPAFRTDKILNIENEDFNKFINKLGEIKTLNELEKTIENKLKDFIKVGCVASDLSVSRIELISDKKDASKVFEKRRKGNLITFDEVNIYKGYLIYFLLKLYSKYNIRSELHIGALRNNNTKMLEKLGPDSGFDSIANDNSIKNLSLLLNKLNETNSLPPMIIFTLNQNWNNELISLISCFQDSSLKGKIQFGAAWWFLDNEKGIRKHLEDLSSNGHLGTFIGMLTDSRSFLSYPRHLYFRRILCSYLGELIEEGKITNDLDFVGKIIKDICYNNVVNYFKID